MKNIILEEFRKIVGKNHVLTDGDLSAYEMEWRRRKQGKSLAVILPKNTFEVTEIVKICSKFKVSIVPQGGNTGLSLGSTPDESGEQIVLSLKRLDKILEIDKDNLTVTVEAGCILQNLQEAVKKEGFLFPLSLAAQGSCTIGGNLASNAGGTQVLRYGNTRQLCLGLEVVTAQGEFWQGLSGLRKDNTGYDLRDLFIGSEGTLGIITTASMIIYPQPVTNLTAFVAISDIKNALNLLNLAQQKLFSGLTGFELMNKFSLNLVNKHMKNLRIPFLEMSESNYYVLLEISDSESENHAKERFENLLELAFENNLILDAVISENLNQSQELWNIRENIPLAQADEGLNIKHDISIKISKIPDFVEYTDKILKDYLNGIRLVNFGHLGDGNLHYNVQAPENIDNKVFIQNHEEEINKIVYDSVYKFDGSFSAEHGVGSLKIKHLNKYKSSIALNIMKNIKQSLDPQNILNPNCILN